MSSNFFPDDIPSVVCVCVCCLSFVCVCGCVCVCVCCLSLGASLLAYISSLCVYSLCSGFTFPLSPFLSLCLLPLFGVVFGVLRLHPFSLRLSTIVSSLPNSAPRRSLLSLLVRVANPPLSSFLATLSLSFSAKRATGRQKHTSEIAFRIRRARATGPSALLAAQQWEGRHSPPIVACISIVLFSNVQLVRLEEGDGLRLSLKRAMSSLSWRGMGDGRR